MGRRGQLGLVHLCASTLPDGDPMADAVKGPDTQFSMPVVLEDEGAGLRQPAAHEKKKKLQNKHNKMPNLSCCGTHRM